jgi:ABC-type uncharacterized transport system substrate-binding protein
MMGARVAVALIMMIVGPLVAPFTADAQQAPKVPRVGVFFASNPTATTRNNEAFTQGQRERGYVEGQNIVLERRYGEARAERMAEVAAELVRMKVDVIVAVTDQPISAVKRQTQSIPIVMVNSTDPVGTGFVASLAHPGGNITGVSMMSPELGWKRLELLREALPQLSRLAVIWNPDVRGAVVEYKQLEAPARSLGLRLQSVEVSHADDLAAAFSAIADARAEAVLVISAGPVMFANRARIASLAQKHRLVSMYGQQDFADAGGLMAYGTAATEGWRRAATFVDKILKGAKPGDLPVEQPTKFELVINLKTAKALGLTIPQTLLQRADQIIQ